MSKVVFDTRDIENFEGHLKFLSLGSFCVLQEETDCPKTFNYTIFNKEGKPIRNVSLEVISSLNSRCLMDIIETRRKNLSVELVEKNGWFLSIRCRHFSEIPLVFLGSEPMKIRDFDSSKSACFVCFSENCLLFVFETQTFHWFEIRYSGSCLLLEDRFYYDPEVLDGGISYSMFPISRSIGSLRSFTIQEILRKHVSYQQSQIPSHLKIEISEFGKSFSSEKS
jgi:hypothetical protein